MKDFASKITPKQTKAVLSLLAQPRIGEAAKDAGISEVTLWRWLQDSEFQAAYRKARHHAVSQAISRLQQTATEAVDTLRQIMLDEENPTTARVTAARTILDLSLRALETEDLERRITALETTIGKR